MGDEGLSTIRELKRLPQEVLEKATNSDIGISMFLAH